MTPRRWAGVGETETLEAKTNFDPPEKGDTAVTHENTHPTCHSLGGFYAVFPTPVSPSTRISGTGDNWYRPVTAA